MLRRIILTTALTLLLAIPAMAGEGGSTIYGVVTFDNAPLTGAMVTVIGELSYTQKTVFTNEKGVYIADKLPADEYIVRALGQPDGVYKPYEKNVFLWRKSTKEVNFPMKKR